MTLVAFLTELRKSVSPKAKIDKNVHYHSVTVKMARKAICWIYVCLDSKGNLLVTGLVVMDDMDTFSAFQAMALVHNIPIQQTNKARQEAIANLPY